MNDLRLIGIGMNMLLGMLLMACSSIPVREAEEVVSQADSLWHEGKMYGIDEGDSATLAQAYETLKAIPLPFTGEGLCPIGLPVTVRRTSSGLGSSFSHSCYHYGKLLRAKDDPVAAMQVFIDATHSHTKDYHILGRVYSNIGDICHLAGEYSLAYDMFNQSAEYFLANGDTLLYYYGLNRSAFELAVQGKQEETLALLSKIENNCSEQEVLSATAETKVIMLMSARDYEAVINNINQFDLFPPALQIAKAQAFYYLQEYDSASFYAQRVVGESESLFDKDNAYYILIHCDSVFSKNNVYELSANRADIEKVIEIRHGKLSQAVQLLEQDLTRKPHYQWLYVIIITLVVVGVIIVAYSQYKCKKKKLLSQQLENLTAQNKAAEKQHEKIMDNLEMHKRNITDEVERNCYLITHADSFPQNIYWNKYSKMCAIVDKQFYFLASKLRTKYKLNEFETRLCILTLLNCKYDQIANLLYRSHSSIGTLKIRVAKKLGTTAKNLRMYLVENECVN